MSVTESVRPFWLAGTARSGAASYAVKSPHNDHIVAQIAVPGAADVEQAIASRLAGLRRGRAPAGARAGNGADACRPADPRTKAMRSPS